MVLVLLVLFVLGALLFILLMQSKASSRVLLREPMRRFLTRIGPTGEKGPSGRPGPAGSDGESSTGPAGPHGATGQPGTPFAGLDDRFPVVYSSGSLPIPVASDGSLYAFFHGHFDSVPDTVSLRANADGWTVPRNGIIGVSGKSNIWVNAKNASANTLTLEFDIYSSSPATVAPVQIATIAHVFAPGAKATVQIANLSDVALQGAIVYFTVRSADVSPTSDVFVSGGFTFR